MDERIVNLETLVAMQDETIANMSKEIYRQQQDLQRMAVRVELLEQKVKELKESPEIGGHEKPPHY